jgi:hypothetical protein
MKPPTDSPPDPIKKPGAASGAPLPKIPVEPPTQPFVIVDGDGPGDPTKFQKFIVPMEFIQKVNSVELPGLDPDDLMDTGTQTPFEPPGPVAQAGQETVVIPKRRPSAPIPKQLLSVASAPRSSLKSKPLWVLGCLLVALILLLSRMKGGSDPTVIGDNLDPATSVPLLPLTVDRTASPVPTAVSTTPATHTVEPSRESGHAAVSAPTNKTDPLTAARREPSRAFKPTASGLGYKATGAPSSVPSVPVPLVTGVTPVIQPE